MHGTFWASPTTKETLVSKEVPPKWTSRSSPWTLQQLRWESALGDNIDSTMLVHSVEKNIYIYIYMCMMHSKSLSTMHAHVVCKHMHVYMLLVFWEKLQHCNLIFIWSGCRIISFKQTALGLYVACSSACMMACNKACRASCLAPLVPSVEYGLQGRSYWALRACDCLIFVGSKLIPRCGVWSTHLWPHPVIQRTISRQWKIPRNSSESGRGDQLLLHNVKVYRIGSTFIGNWKSLPWVYQFLAFIKIDCPMSSGNGIATR